MAEWQFEINHQPVSADSDAVKDVRETLAYIVDAGTTLGTFLRFVAPVTCSVAEQCIRVNIVSK